MTHSWLNLWMVEYVDRESIKKTKTDCIWRQTRNVYFGSWLFWGFFVVQMDFLVFCLCIFLSSFSFNCVLIRYISEHLIEPYIVLFLYFTSPVSEEHFMLLCILFMLLCIWKFCSAFQSKRSCSSSQQFCYLSHPLKTINCYCCCLNVFQICPIVFIPTLTSLDQGFVISNETRVSWLPFLLSISFPFIVHQLRDLLKM